MSALADRLPAGMVETIARYVERRIPPGDFMVAVLSNDLRRAMAHGDREHVAALRDIVTYCHWEVDGLRWGSRKVVEDWLAGREGVS